jgi:hypothetical protein
VINSTETTTPSAAPKDSEAPAPSPRRGLALLKRVTRRAWPVLRWLILQAPTLGALAFALLAVCSMHFGFFEPPRAMNPKDEGYILAFGRRMIEGQWLPYVDGASHRGPMLYWVAAIAVWLSKEISYYPVRILALGCSVLTMGFTYIAAARLKHRLAGAVAMLAIMVSFILDMMPVDGTAFNGEPLLDVFVFGALVALAFGLAPERRHASVVLAGVAGMLAAFGALSKQVGSVTIPAFFLWVLIVCLNRPDGTGLRRFRPALAFAIGVVLPVLVVVARYAAAGELKTLYFYTVTYNSHYYMAPYNSQRWKDAFKAWVMTRPEHIAGALGLVAAGIARPFARARRGTWLSQADQHGFVLTVALCSGATLAVSNGTLRDFWHYYVQVVPWFGLLFGLMLEQLANVPPLFRWRRFAVEIAVLFPAMYLLWQLWPNRVKDYASGPSTSQICTYVDQHTKPTDAIYFWGFCPDLYIYCKRRAGSRYVYSTFQSGYVPYFDHATREQDKKRVVPGAPELFLKDLDASQTKLIIDIPFTLGGRSILEYPEYKAYLDEKYCAPTPYDRTTVWHRRDVLGGCPVPEHRP